MNLYEIQSAYQQRVPFKEINQTYKSGLAEGELTDEEKIELWKQVCAFGNFEMIDELIAQGWRTMGVEDAYGNNLLHIMAEAEFGRSYTMSEGQIYETTKRLLANKVSPIRKNSEGFTALMLGAKAGYFEMFQAYQDAGVKIDWADSKGNTLLHICAENSGSYASDLSSAQDEYLEFVQAPHYDENSRRDVSRKAELEWRYQLKQNRLSDFVNFISMGIEAGLDPFQKNNYGETAIDIAVKVKSKIAGALLKGDDLSNKENVDWYIQAGGQDIYQTCINQDVKAVDALIKLGENLNEEYDKEGDRYHGMLPLAIAIILHDFEIVDLLLKNGADVQLMDSKSWHPLRYLYATDSTINTNSNQFEDKIFQKILQAFVKAGFDINTLMDDEENTLLTLSAKNADSLQLFNGNSIAKVIMEEAIFADADVNKTNRDGISALMYLGLTDLRRAEKEFLMLLEQGAKTDLKDKDGKTALIYATNNSEKSTAKTYCELMEQFGDILVNAKDNSEKSALDYAVEKDNENLVAWFLERQ
ncbi:ankyrin repeat domain-containing protein [Flavobacterium tegetincola]|uniref:ankyrin repeat domain-containing protein n=1 Tax=Flavobacterium tegetincola TaxID=150172 RepID=UPI0004147359|nr:ankyrin repeat domain-containing protein [Flavobacterium tegetincola]